MPSKRTLSHAPRSWRNWRPSAEVRLLVIAMLLAAVLLAMVEYVYLEHSHESALRTHAGIVAHSVSAAAVFDSQRDATESLQAFKAVPDVAAAHLHKNDGAALATYRRDEALRTWWQRHGGQMRVQVPVFANGSEVARLEVIADRGQLWSTLASLLA